MNPTPLEHDEQKNLFEWAAWMTPQLPELAAMIAIPNGGHRHKGTAAKLKAEGVKPGFPDIFLPAAKGKFHGLFIEMKRRKGGRVEPEQAEWHNRLRAAGYRVEVCQGFEAAQAVILDYLGRGPITHADVMSAASEIGKATKDNFRHWLARE